jgi:hypothetical protein
MPYPVLEEMGFILPVIGRMPVRRPAHYDDLLTL